MMPGGKDTRLLLAVAESAATAAEYDWHRDQQTPIFDPQQAAT